MSGNVWEWVSSIPQHYPYDATDGREASGDSDSSSPRIMRGGSWAISEWFPLTADIRYYAYPDDTRGDLGFRCARDYEP